MIRRFSLLGAVVMAVGCGASEASPVTEVSNVEANPFTPWTADARFARSELTATDQNAMFMRTASALFVQSGPAEPARLALGALTEPVDGGNLTSIRRAFAFDRSNTDVIYRGTGKTVEKSVDRGRTFAPIFDGSTLAGAAWVQQIAVSPVDPAVVYAVLAGGKWGVSSIPETWVMRSTDGGTTWKDITRPIAPAARAFFAGDVIHPHPYDAKAFFVGHPSGTSGRDTGRNLVVSRDAGDTYEKIASPLGTYTKAIATADGRVVSVHESDPRAETAKLCVRDEAGAELSCVAAPAALEDGSPCAPFASFGAVTASTGEGASIFLAVRFSCEVAGVSTPAGMLLRSKDARTWETLFAPAPGGISSLAYREGQLWGSTDKSVVPL